MIHGQYPMSLDSVWIKLSHACEQGFKNHPVFEYSLPGKRVFKNFMLNQVGKEAATMINKIISTAPTAALK